MSLLSGFAIYFIIWWLVLFAVLPWGAHSAHELGEAIGEGHAPSAPVKPALGRKFIVTTLISLVIFAGVYALIVSEFVSFEDVPWLPKFRTA